MSLLSVPSSSRWHTKGSNPSLPFWIRFLKLQKRRRVTLSPPLSRLSVWCRPLSASSMVGGVPAEISQQAPPSTPLQCSPTLPLPPTSTALLHPASHQTPCLWGASSGLLCHRQSSPPWVHHPVPPQPMAVQCRLLQHTHSWLQGLERRVVVVGAERVPLPSLIVQVEVTIPKWSQEVQEGCQIPMCTDMEWDQGSIHPTSSRHTDIPSPLMPLSSESDLEVINGIKMITIIDWLIDSHYPVFNFPSRFDDHTEVIEVSFSFFFIGKI